MLDREIWAKGMERKSRTTPAHNCVLWNLYWIAHKHIQKAVQNPFQFQEGKETNSENKRKNANNFDKFWWKVANKQWQILCQVKDIDDDDNKLIVKGKNSYVEEKEREKNENEK